MKVMIDRGLCTTINIKHLADSSSLKKSTNNKKYCGLIIMSVEMPNASYINNFNLQEPMV